MQQSFPWFDYLSELNLSAGKNGNLAWDSVSFLYQLFVPSGWRPLKTGILWSSRWSRIPSETTAFPPIYPPSNCNLCRLQPRLSRPGYSRVQHESAFGEEPIAPVLQITALSVFSLKNVHAKHNFLVC